MYLDATTRSVEILLGSSITTNQLPVVCSWVDHTTTTVTPGTTRSISNNTTAVIAVAAPAASTQRQVQTINIYNNDTVSATVTVRLNDNSTIAILMKATIRPDETLHYDSSKGWQIFGQASKMPAGGATNTVLIKQSSTNFHTDFATIGTSSLADGSVTSAKLENRNAGIILGRRSGSSGVPEELIPSYSLVVDAMNLGLVNDSSSPPDRSLYAIDPATSLRGWVPFDELGQLIKTENTFGVPISIASVGSVTVFTASNLSISINDRFTFEACILILNNSAATKTYTFNIRMFDGSSGNFGVFHADGTTVATHATNQTMVYVYGVISYARDNPPLSVAALITDHGLGSAVNTGVNAVLASSRRSWNVEEMTMTSASTGQFFFDISSSANNATQECVVVGASLRRSRLI